MVLTVGDNIRYWFQYCCMVFSVSRVAKKGIWVFLIKNRDNVYSGSMLGFSIYTLKGNLTWFDQKSGEKQHKDGYNCQGLSSGLSGGWSHDQLPKMVKNKSCSPGL